MEALEGILLERTILWPSDLRKWRWRFSTTVTTLWISLPLKTAGKGQSSMQAKDYIGIRTC